MKANAGKRQGGVSSLSHGGRDGSVAEVWWALWEQQLHTRTSAEAEGCIVMRCAKWSREVTPRAFDLWRTCAVESVCHSGRVTKGN